MKTYIKLLTVGLIALLGIFALVGTASAQTVVPTCTSATLYGTVTPNGTPTEAWFEWGPTTSLGNSTPRRTYYSTTSYEAVISGLTQDTVYYYRAMAQNPYGTATGATKSFRTNDCTPAPTVSISANPSNIDYGNTSTISWSSTNATSCNASGGSSGWSGARNTQGYFYTSALTTSTTYTITCSNSAGSDTKSTTVTVNQRPIQNPTVDLTANSSNISYNSSTILRWSSQNASYCSGNGFYTGNTTNGSVSTGNLTSTRTYSITCYGESGSTPATDSVTVTVAPRQIDNPTVDLTANSSNISYNSSTILRWSSQNASYCSGNGFYTGNTTNGSVSTGNLTSTRTYSITCYGESGSTPATDSVTVTVGSQPQMTGTISASPSSCTIPSGSSSCNSYLTWNTVNPEGTSAVTKAGNTQVAYGNSNSNFPVQVGSGVTAFYLYNNSKLLDQTSVSASCASGSSWNGYSCSPNTSAPTVTISANPNSVNYGGYSTITWSTTNNPTSCYASGDWSGNKSTNGGTENVGPLNQTRTYTYTIECSNSAGTSGSRSATVSVGQAPQMTGTISASPSSCTIPSGSSSCNSYLTWNTVNPEGTSAVTKAGNTQVAYGNSNSNFPVQVGSGVTAFYLYNNSKLLDQTSVSASCASGSSWNGTSCTPNVTAPTVNLNANPQSASYNGTSMLSWNSSGATSCNANSSNGSWTGTKSTSGSFYTGRLTSTVTYYITCSNSAGSADASTTVTVGGQPVQNPTVNLSANPTIVDYGNSTNLTWNSTNADSCYATGFDAGGATSGSRSSGALYSDTSFTITCMNSSGGSRQANVSVAVRDQENNERPSVTLTADRTYVDYRGSTYLRWYSTNAESCSVSGGTGSWSGSKSTQGYFYTGELTFGTSYNITCTNNYGSDSDQVYITVGNNNQNQTPSVSTYAANNINYYNATLNGYVGSLNNANVRGWFEWGTSSYYGTRTNEVNYGSGGSGMSYQLSGLSPNTTYYFRAVAQADGGQMAYGTQRSFTTSSDYYNPPVYNNPQVTTYQAYNVQTNSATLSGVVDPNGTSTSTWFEWGTNYSSLNRTTNSRNISYRSNISDQISGLSTNTIYYFRAVARGNNGQTVYGNILNFTTTGTTYYNNCTNSGTCAPTAITSFATNIGNTSARLNGVGYSTGSVSNTGYFEYGTTTSLGRTTESKYIGSGTANPYYISLFGLSSGTTYYYRAVVTNQYGTAYGDLETFRTNVPSTNTNTNTNNTNTTNTTTTTTTVVTNNSNLVGVAKPSLVFLSINRTNEFNEYIRRGDTLEYVIYYKNISVEELSNVVLQVLIPKELEYVDASRGFYSEVNNRLVVNIGALRPGEEGSVYVTVRVNNDAPLNKLVVVSTNLAYTIMSTGAQEEVFAYAKSTVVEGVVSSNQLGALAVLFGSSFLPNTLLGWLILILLIVLLIMVIRRFFDRSTVVVSNGNGESTTTEIHH